MNDIIEVQYHHWPWSIGDNKSTVNLTNGDVNIDFYGSPVFSVSTNADLFLSSRYEKFLPFGPKFYSAGGIYRIFQAPHGVIASKNSSSSEIIEGNKRRTSINIKAGLTSETILLHSAGALASTIKANQSEESPLYNTVRGWSNFFDEFIERKSLPHRKGELPWSGILEFIEEVSNDDKEPKMALIVHISEEMRKNISSVACSARRILLRNRELVPAGRVSETDTACMLWYARQPGETTAQKAAANRQRLLAVARRESLDTLENKVLKDFLRRCTDEGRRYLKNDCSDDQRRNSQRGQLVTSYSRICADLHRSPYLESVTEPPAAIRPNHVLQSDFRYRRIWNLYQRLRRNEDEQDRLWDWQSRTWADISRMLVNAALMSLCDSSDSTNVFTMSAIAESVFHLTSEQRLGSRIVPGTEPGPFLVKPKDTNGIERALILEIVHSDVAGEHATTQNFGRIGGHLYLVLSPLSGKKQSVIILWAAHTAACDPSIRPSWPEIVSSASDALKRHALMLGERVDRFPSLHGFVIASDMACIEPEIHPAKEGGANVLQIPTDQTLWREAVDFIALILEDAMSKLL